MWKVESIDDFQRRIEEHHFYSFEEAKGGLRDIINKVLQNTIGHYMDIIDKYCQKFYPNGAPEEILRAKDIIYKIVTNPKLLIGAPELENDFFFSDDNIEISLFENVLHLYPAGASEDDIPEDWKENFKFVVAEINVTDFYDPDIEYCFYIDDKKDYSVNISLEYGGKDDLEDLVGSIKDFAEDDED